MYEHSFASVVIYIHELSMSSSSSESEQSFDGLSKIYTLIQVMKMYWLTSRKFRCESV